MGASQSDLENFKDPGPAVTEERIIRAVKSYEKAKDVIIQKMEDASGNVKGEGFMSALAILKVEAIVDGENKTYSWVVKSTPRELNKALMGIRIRTDEREVNFFGKLLPTLKNFLTSQNLLEIMPKTCTIPYCSWTDDDKVLIMQNLKTLGYRDAVNKKAGLDIEHVRAAMKWMATFHAITYAFVDKYEGGVDKVMKDFDLFFWKFEDMIDWEKEVAPFRDVGNDQQRSMFKGIDEKNPGKNFVGILEKVIAEHGDLGTLAMKVRDKQSYKLKTICHGDPWFNNMMFMYNDDGKLKDILFIDFQMMGYMSPALDLVYFLAASTTGDLRRSYMPHILTLYHTIFIQTLDRFGISVNFTYEDLQEDVRKAKAHGLNFALGALPSILAENTDDVVDTEEWMKAINEEDAALKEQKIKEVMDQMNASYNKNDAVVQRMKDLVEEWAEAGEFLEGI